MFRISHEMTVAMGNCLICLLICFCMSTVTKCDDPTSTASDPGPTLHLIADDNHVELLPARSALNALDDLLTYVSSGEDELNLDGLVGINIVTGQLRGLLRRAKSIPDDLKTDIQRTIAFGALIIAKDTPLIAASEPDYYEQLKCVLNESFFEYDYDLRTTNKSLILSRIADIDSGNLNGSLSDHCLSQLQGIGTVNGQSCFITKECLNYMISANRTGYFLTHQLIYLLFIESLNCEQQFANAIDTFSELDSRCQTVPEMQDIMCANVIQEMKDFETNDFHGDGQDLFLEQVAVCGMLGFREVCTKPWLHLILRWQNSSGCYLLKDSPVLGRRRVKRNDVVFPDGCSSHKTGVAAGALGVCVRIHVEDPSSN